ncbi:hypothetical protein AMAG_19293 [Allomyces macrogynus ATCC 38327]|uniref:Uncharacterized protein n=1 Tax=Allomyces macrogynus (strain ATCC 38327) TaxID=578462 RepID=A0A0L0SQT7_ALLM3|nr:hypothetical protein AMAG_19293 [Allomyces macrogynus ATCC 38327]|eukprot:KNE64867.1 hypothetical protein AMAG_19293 [Allomyces macrogynus ATCC 38327]
MQPRARPTRPRSAATGKGSAAKRKRAGAQATATATATATAAAATAATPEANGANVTAAAAAKAPRPLAVPVPAVAKRVPSPDIAIKPDPDASAPPPPPAPAHPPTSASSKPSRKRRISASTWSHSAPTPAPAIDVSSVLTKDAMWFSTTARASTPDVLARPPPKRTRRARKSSLLSGAPLPLPSRHALPDFLLLDPDEIDALDADDNGPVPATSADSPFAPIGSADHVAALLGAHTLPTAPGSSSRRSHHAAPDPFVALGSAEHVAALVGHGAPQDEIEDAMTYVQWSEDDDPSPPSRASSQGTAADEDETEALDAWALQCAAGVETAAGAEDDVWAAFRAVAVLSQRSGQQRQGR